MRSEKIFKASQQLERKAISPMDFLNQVLHNDNDLLNNLSEIGDGVETADDETELDAGIAADVAAEFIAVPISSEGGQPSVSKESIEPLSMLDELANVKDGSCIACNSNMASVVFIGCNHNSVCSPCWENLKKVHIENCHKWYSDNPRKLQRELKTNRCPSCGAYSQGTLEIRANTF